MSVVQEFRDREIARLEHSGWATNAALRQRLESVGLRPPAEVVAECLDERAGAEGEVGARWARAEHAVARLREHFAPFRFSDDVDYGLLAVPASNRLDTRGAMDLNIRRGQQPDLTEDFVDPALGEGADLADSTDAAGATLGKDGWMVVAGVVALNVVNGMHGPDKAVESYLTLLSEGKATEATKMVDPGVPNDQRKLLTDDALKAAKARIKVTKIEEPTITGDTATIKAHLSLDGKAFKYDFTASKTSGSFGLDSWKVDKPLVVSADFSSSAFPGLKVAGVAIDMAKDKDGLSGYRSTQVAYPGVYPVAAPDSVSKYLTAKETSFTLIPTGEGASAEAESVGTQTVNATPTDELKTKALAKVKEQTKTCATVPTNSDKPCPFQLTTDMTSLSVEKDATKVEFSKDISNDLSFTSDEISISGSPKPTAFDKNPSPRKAKFTFSGKVELPEGGGDPTITIESSSSVF